MQSRPAPAKTPRRAVDGVLLLDKGNGLTSNAALQRAKRLFNAAKAGHTGTLDPMATGLLPLCFGEATKFSSDLLESDKTYEAIVALGVTTDTADAEGRVLQRSPVTVIRGDVESALTRFRGAIEQVPPMHSALKHQGRPLYSYAREGTSIERAARAVVIHRLDLVQFVDDRLAIEVECSKGTYIRTLAEEIGAALGCGAHLAGLRRTRVGALGIVDAVDLETLERLDPAARDARLRPLDSLVAALPDVSLDADSARRFGQGQSIAGPGFGAPGAVRVYADARFLGVGKVAEDGALLPARLVAQTPARVTA
jgi:tRNA pseudouridine55 synthase